MPFVFHFFFRALARWPAPHVSIPFRRLWRSRVRFPIQIKHRQISQIFKIFNLVGVDWIVKTAGARYQGAIEGGGKENREPAGERASERGDGGKLLLLDDANYFPKVEGRLPSPVPLHISSFSSFRGHDKIKTLQFSENQSLNPYRAHRNREAKKRKDEGSFFNVCFFFKRLAALSEIQAAKKAAACSCSPLVATRSLASHIATRLQKHERDRMIVCGKQQEKESRKAVPDARGNRERKRGPKG